MIPDRARPETIPAPDGRDLLRGVMVDITENREAEEALKRRIATLESEVAALTQIPPSSGRC